MLLIPSNNPLKAFWQVLRGCLFLRPGGMCQPFARTLNAFGADPRFFGGLPRLPALSG